MLICLEWRDRSESSISTEASENQIFRITQFNIPALKKWPIPVFRCFCATKYWKLYIFHGVPLQCHMAPIKIPHIQCFMLSTFLTFSPPRLSPVSIQLLVYKCPNDRLWEWGHGGVALVLQGIRLKYSNLSCSIWIKISTDKLNIRQIISWWIDHGFFPHFYIILAFWA